MDDLHLKQVPVAKTGMLIRRPVAAVFAAFNDPEVTTKFWFTKSSGRLEAGKQVKWEWEIYDASTQAVAEVIEPNKLIIIEWDGYSGHHSGMEVHASKGWHDVRRHHRVWFHRRRRRTGETGHRLDGRVWFGSRGPKGTT
jgi:hypothetical protein